MAIVKVLAVLGLVTLATANINITSPPITDWGEWGIFERCPFGRYAQGFQLKTEPNQLLGDDTALNAIRLFCGDPYRADTAVITSTEGDFGTWGHVYNCFPNVLIGFQLRVESNRGSGDDTATNNARFTCSEDANSYIEGDGMYWGDWSTAQRCYSNQAICSIQTQVEPYMADNGDDTMLNNVRLECCDVSKKELQAGFDYVKKHGPNPQVLSPEFAALLREAKANEQKGASNPEEKVEKLNVAQLIRKRTENNEVRQTINTSQLLKQISESVQKEQYERIHKAGGGASNFAKELYV